MTKIEAKKILEDIDLCNAGKRNCIGCSLRDCVHYSTNNQNCLDIETVAKQKLGLCE